MIPDAAATWTVDECAAEWGVAPATWRSYVATGRAPQPLPGYDADRRRHWVTAEVRSYQRPGQGQRNDLTARRIGEMFRHGREIAEVSDRYDEWSKINEQILSGNPGAVRALLGAARRWAKGKPVHAASLARIEELAAQVGDLGASILPMRVREQIMIAESQDVTPLD